MSGALSRTRVRIARVHVHRSLSFLGPLASLILAGGAAWAESLPLTDAEVIRGALARPAWLEAASGSC